MSTNAPRSIAVIGGVALIALAFGLGYVLSRPAPPGKTLEVSEAAAAVSDALKEPNELERAGDLVPLLTRLDAGNVDAVVGAYEATFQSVGPGIVALEMLAEAWSKLDPAGAFQRMLGWDEYWRGITLPLLARSWARQDRVSAKAAVEAMAPGPLRNQVSAAVIHGWADTQDPAVWDGFVAGLPFGSNVSYNLLERIGARDGTDAMLARAEAVSDDAPGDFRRIALMQAVDAAAAIDPRLTAAFLEQRRETLGVRLEGTLAKRWAENDGLAATAWASTQPEGVLRDAALRAAFTGWLQSDQLAALEWAGGQSDAQVAPLLGLYANALGRTDPKRGLEASLRITDPGERQQIQWYLARVWLRQQPQLARGWLEENGLAGLITQIQGPRDPAPAQPGHGGGPDGEKVD